MVVLNQEPGQQQKSKKRAILLYICLYLSIKPPAPSNDILLTRELEDG